MLDVSKGVTPAGDFYRFVRHFRAAATRASPGQGMPRPYKRGHLAGRGDAWMAAISALLLAALAVLWSGAAGPR